MMMMIDDDDDDNNDFLYSVLPLTDQSVYHLIITPVTEFNYSSAHYIEHSPLPGEHSS